MSHVLYDEIGPKTRRRIRITTLVSGILLALASLWIIIELRSKGQLDGRLWAIVFQPDLFVLLGQGLFDTLRAAGVAMFLSIIIGTAIAIGRLSDNAWMRVLLRIATEVLRGLPLLLLIFFIYLGGPVLGLDFSTFWALVTGITLYNCVVIAEIIRAGILSLPRGQSEAASAIGLRRGQIFRYILIPQAIRRMLPSLVSQLVTLLKETSLGFIIGYTELLRNGRTIVEYLGGQYSIPVYTLIAVIYLVINTLLSRAAHRLERSTAA